MASGAKVADNVKTVFNGMKVVKSDADQNERVRLVIFGFVDGLIDATKTYKEKDLVGEDVYKFFEGLLEKGLCRYIVYDCHYETKESKKEELIFVTWCSEEAPIKQKMNYASSKDALSKTLGGLKHSFQLNDISDLGNRADFASRLGDVISVEGTPINP